LGGVGLKRSSLQGLLSGKSENPHHSSIIGGYEIYAKSEPKKRKKGRQKRKKVAPFLVLTPSRGEGMGGWGVGWGCWGVGVWVGFGGGFVGSLLPGLTRQKKTTVDGGRSRIVELTKKKKKKKGNDLREFAST